ncbi:hypothetical protein JCM6882_002150 [Rhodosporidiobolus microsporus]
MAAVGRLLKRDPSLTPLLFVLISSSPQPAAVGFGVCGALAFGSHYLRHSPDVVIKKKQTPDPWNNVDQSRNTKLMTQNRDWWASRAGTPNPRAVFASPVEEPELTGSTQASAAKENAMRRAKEKTLAMFEKDGMKSSGEWKERSVDHPQ